MTKERLDMGRYEDMYDARREAEEHTLRVKYYATVYGGSVLVLLTIVAAVMLGVFVDPGAFTMFLLTIFTILIPGFGYAEYAEPYHTQRILRKREKREDEEMKLSEAERIVAAFGKGK